MNRRRFLRIGGGGLAIATGGLAGCLGSNGSDGSDEPPPRKAEVFEDVSIADGTMEIALDSEPKVESTIDNVDESAIVGSLLPIGTARAGSRSSGSGSGRGGATGRGSGGYSSAPTGRHGWAIYGGHSHRNWRDDHEDETQMYTAAIAALGVAYMGSNSQYQTNSPGPEPVDWDREWSDLDPGTTLEVDLATLTSDSDPDAESGATAGNETATESPTENETAAESSTENETDTDTGDGVASTATADEGWYRVGTHLESPGGETNFNWQAADFKLDRSSTGRLTVDEEWHVRPRL
ncbi:hypothetical protein [Natrinema sp. SYSU A 869]|uniref:hypothetical protein n=1 Tax=Natrinema sp. SYSU A 869 TaxID=2871694 RepID=UPI002106E553|nr:hypothetical protein [Natrinema sp. SYSU A 869]